MPRLFYVILLVVACMITAASDVHAQKVEPVDLFGADSVVEGTRVERETDLVLSVSQLLICSPLRMPKITSRFGMRRHPVTGEHSFHSGVNLTSTDPIVMSVHEGKIVEVEEHPYLGRFVRIDHVGVYSIYGHLFTSLVSAGDRVGAGQAIGIMGQTGRATGIHLHFSIRIGNRYVDPVRFLLRLQEEFKNK